MYNGELLTVGAHKDSKSLEDTTSQLFKICPWRFSEAGYARLPVKTQRAIKVALMALHQVEGTHKLLRLNSFPSKILLNTAKLLSLQNVLFLRLNARTWWYKSNILEGHQDSPIQWSFVSFPLLGTGKHCK